MWRLLILTALALCQATVATPTAKGNADGEQLRAGLLCGDYSMNVNETLYIKSKGLGNTYPKDYQCDYNFQCNDYASSLIFSCKTFELQKSEDCKKDFLRVYDGDTVNDKYCGTDNPDNVVTSGAFLGIKFSTNGDNIRRKGFFCSVTCLHNDQLITTTTTTVSTTSTSTTSTTTSPTTPTTTLPIVTPAEYTGCRCGIPNRPSRIVNGDITRRGDYPWHMAVVKERLMIPFCSGVLLNNMYGLTTAHCVQHKYIEIILGEYDWSKISRVIKRKPLDVIIHSEFNPTTLVNDLAIIKFSPVNLNGPLPISPICLPDIATDFTNTLGIVTGWGKTSETGFMSPVLREVELPILDPNTCSSPDPQHVCAGELTGGKDRCYGDDGGPLSVEVQGRHVLAGITTRKKGCAKPNDPAWFAEIQSRLSWISGIIADGKGCPSDDIPTSQAVTTSISPTSSASTTESEESSSTSTTASTTPFIPPGSRCACGLPTIRKRNSILADIYQYPWTVILISKSSDEQFCSGSPVNSRFILSAASCTRSMTDIQVRASAQDMRSTTPVRYINRNVVRIITNSDLMLLELDNPLSLINWDGILSACLPSPSTMFPTLYAEHSGYGSFSSGGAPSPIIKANSGNYVPCSLFGSSTRDCYQPFQSPGFCGPDIGGPIVSLGPDGRRYLRGIAFSDQGCGRVDQEVVRVADHESWIRDNSQGGSFCLL